MEFIVIRNDQEDNDELFHHGIKGQKWGERRFQNKDGSLTPEGQKRRSLGQTIKDYKIKKKRKSALEKARATKEANKKAAEEEKAKTEKRAKDLAAGKISAKKMTDAELADSLRRKENEKKYNDAVLATSTGKRFASKIWNDGVVPGISEGVKNTVNKFIQKKASDFLGLDVKPEKSAYEKLKESADIAKLKKQKFQDERDLAEAQKKYQDYLNNQKKEQENRKTASEETNKRRDQDYEYDKNQRKSNNDYNSKAKTYTGEVVGEGTSSSQYKNRNGSLGSSKKADDYYDPIDTYGEWVNDRSTGSSSNLPAVQVNSGIQYVSKYLKN